MSEVIVNIILDKSGSMQAVADATISGFNEYLSTLRADKENSYKVSLTLFNDTAEVVYTAKPLEQVKDLTKFEYATSGMTALYDAACNTINFVRHGMCANCEGKVKNIVVILTDGMENCSREFTQKEFKTLVDALQKLNNWTFVFLGANQDSWAVAQQFGFQQANVANYVHSSVGVKSAFSAMARGTIETSNSNMMANMDFFSRAEDMAEKSAEESVKENYKNTTTGGTILKRVSGYGQKR